MKIFQNTILIMVVISLSMSCIKDETPELQAKHDELLQEFMTEFGITESNLLSEGIYAKNLSTSPSGQPNDSISGDYVIVDVLGYNDVNSVFDVTNYDDAIEHNLSDNEQVFGPIRLNINNLIPGLYIGIKTMLEGDKTVFLLSHEQAFDGYTPIVYEVQLYNSFDNIETFDSIQFATYKDFLEMDESDRENDTSEYKGTYIKQLIQGDSIPDLAIGDEVTINLNAYYVETDTSYLDSLPGREFFPLNDTDKEVEFTYGEGFFPITEILHVLVGGMKLGEKIEILSPHEYVYGESGFLHPYTGIFVVPPGMAVHYVVELVDYKKVEAGTN